MARWTEQAFGPWYLRLYAHRDDAEARHAVATLGRWLPPGGRFLDAACGPGRHLAALRAAGREGVGLDQSWTLLRASDPGDLVLVRGDMRRLPFTAGTFAGVLSMFTSFGYFEDQAAHRRLLAEFRRVTAPGGVLALDYLNADHVRAGLRPSSARRVGDHHVEERRWIRETADGERVVKEVTIRDGRDRVVERYREEVAMYDPPTVTTLLLASGWEESARFGDYLGAAWTPRSPRLFLVARAGGPT
jgi:SAM-dependent methyltransferase